MRDTPENRATQEILLGTRGVVRWWRNRVEPAHPTYAPARTVLYGLGGAGGSDYIGIEFGTGRFVALEIKRARGGRTTEAQLEFLRHVREAGGVGVVATCAQDVLDRLAEPCEIGKPRAV